MNILQTFCFSSESVQLLCSRDVNQKYFNVFHWFPNHFLHFDHGIINFFVYLYDRDAKKLTFEKLQDGMQG